MFYYKTLIADAAPLFRNALIAVLEKQPLYKIVGETKRSDSLLKLTETRSIDVIITDTNLSGTNALDVISAIKRMSSTVRILVYTSDDSAQSIKKAYQNGADGYLLKTEGEKSLFDALHTIIQGNIYFHPKLKKYVFSDSQNLTSTIEISDAEQLTPREREILRYISNGYRTIDIAEELCISRFTVRNHRRNILQKLNLRNTADMVKYHIQSAIN